MNTLNDQLAKIADDLKTDEEKIQVSKSLRASNGAFSSLRTPPGLKVPA